MNSSLKHVHVGKPVTLGLVADFIANNGALASKDLIEFQAKLAGEAHYIWDVSYGNQRTSIGTGRLKIVPLAIINKDGEDHVVAVEFDSELPSIMIANMNTQVYLSGGILSIPYKFQHPEFWKLVRFISESLFVTDLSYKNPPDEKRIVIDTMERKLSFCGELVESTEDMDIYTTLIGVSTKRVEHNKKADTVMLSL